MSAITYYLMVTKQGRDLCPAVPSGAWSSGSVADVVGTPSDLSGAWYLWGGGAIPASHIAADQSMAWPGGFCRSAFRVVRDPNLGADDTADPDAITVYQHGWALADRLDAMLQDVWENDPTWLTSLDYAVQVVTCTPTVNDGGRGWYGAASVTPQFTRPLRDLLEGGIISKVATIIDSLLATSTSDRTAIGSTYATNNSSGLIDAAQTALQSAAAGLTAANAARFAGRTAYVYRAGLAGVGLTPSLALNGNLGKAIHVGMLAVLAKEAGLVGATFTTTLYNRMVAPLKAAITMPAGY